MINEEMFDEKSIVDLSEYFFRKSDQVLLDADEHLCRVLVPRTETTVHFIQFLRPLTAERRFFFVELENISMYFLSK